MDPGVITDIATVVVAVLALGLTVWQGYLARQHNRLSLNAILNFDVRLSPDYERAEIRIDNQGTGYARITSFQMLIDGGTREELNINRWEELTKHLGFRTVTSYNHLRQESVIKPGHGMYLVSLPLGKFTPARTKRIRDGFRKLRFIVEYESPYKDKNEVEFDGTEVYGKQESN